MSDKIKVALLYGGKSGEHEVSLRSAACVLHQLDGTKYDIIPIGIDKNGCYHLNDYQTMLAYSEALPISVTNSQALDHIVFQGKFAVDVDIVFPITHGPLYEDGCLQGILTSVDVAYVGCDVLASAISMNKDIARRLLCLTEGLQFARYHLLSSYASAQETKQFCHKVISELGLPLFVKPCSLGSSVGVHKVNDVVELEAAIVDAKRYDDSILVEECIKGREIELAVLENATDGTQPLVSLAGEIRVRHPDGFYSYTAKYIESQLTDLIIPVSMDESMLRRLQSAAVQAFINFKCKGMARIDFFVTEGDGTIYFNELNTLPGFTTISMYPKLWEASGISFPNLLDRLIELGRMHHQRRQQLLTHYQ